MTLWLYQPAAFGLDVGPRSVITGLVLSILKSWLAAPAATVLPARSVNAGLLTVTGLPSPTLSFVSVAVGSPAEPKPDRPSDAVNVAVTVVLFQPAALAAGDWLV